MAALRIFLGIATFLTCLMGCLGVADMSNSDRPLDAADSAALTELLLANRIPSSYSFFHDDVTRDSYGRVTEITFTSVERDSFIIPFTRKVLPECTHLNWRGNRFRALGDGLRYLESVEGINLDNNRFARFPEVLLALPALKSLTLRGNALRELPPDLDRLSNLQLLWIEDNLLEAIPSVLARMPTLVNLSLGGNHIGALDSSFCACGKIATLNLAGNSITALPACDYAAWSSQWLILNDNGLAEIPAALGGNRSLLGLFLPRNRLVTLPPGLGGLPLQMLDLSDNVLTDLPADLTSITTLRERDWGGGVKVDGNRLCALPDSLKEWAERYAPLDAKDGVWLKRQACGP